MNSTLLLLARDKTRPRRYLVASPHFYYIVRVKTLINNRIYHSKIQNFGTLGYLLWTRSITLMLLQNAPREISLVALTDRLNL